MIAVILSGGVGTRLWPVSREPLADGVYAVRRFVEKPDALRAKSYLEQGGFFWNAGIFCFQARAYLEALHTHAAEVYESVLRGWQASPPETPQYLDTQTFHAVPSISVDYAVMEKAEQVAAIGVEDLVIVDTRDALLVTRRDKVQDVKKVVERLQKVEHDAAREHRTVQRRWGSYTVLEEGAQFKIKRLVIQPGQSLSFHLHHHRSEHWTVVSGTAQVLKEDQTHLLRTNEALSVLAGTPHRLSNPGLIDLVIIEVQSGAYLGEDDLVRLEPATQGGSRSNGLAEHILESGD